MKSSQEKNFLTVLESLCPVVLSISCTNRTSRKAVCALQDEMNNLMFFCIGRIEVASCQKMPISIFRIGMCYSGILQQHFN